MRYFFRKDSYTVDRTHGKKEEILAKTPELTRPTQKHKPKLLKAFSCDISSKKSSSKNDRTHKRVHKNATNSLWESSKPRQIAPRSPNLLLLQIAMQTMSLPIKTLERTIECNHNDTIAFCMLQNSPNGGKKDRWTRKAAAIACDECAGSCLSGDKL